MAEQGREGPYAARGPLPPSQAAQQSFTSPAHEPPSGSFLPPRGYPYSVAPPPGAAMEIQGHPPARHFAPPPPQPPSVPHGLAVPMKAPPFAAQEGYEYKQFGERPAPPTQQQPQPQHQQQHQQQQQLQMQQPHHPGAGAPYQRKVMEDQMSPSAMRALHQLAKLRGSAHEPYSARPGALGQVAEDYVQDAPQPYVMYAADGSGHSMPSDKPHATLGQMAAQVQANARGVPEDDNGGDDIGQVCAPGTEQTGRWTKAEHDLFLKALKRFGKEWKRVAAMVKTRTVVQTRTHAQKYFQKLQKTIGSNVDDISDYELPMGESSLNDDHHDGDGGSGRKDSSYGSNPHKRRKIGRSSEGYDDGSDRRASSGSGRRWPQVKGPAELIGNAMAAAATGPKAMHMAMHPHGALSIRAPNSIGLHHPKPSPAACGSRKQEELVVAQLLAATGAGHTGDAAAGMVTAKALDDVKACSPSLSITNPDQLSPLGGPTSGLKSKPVTPWDGQIKTLRDTANMDQSDTGAAATSASGEDGDSGTAEKGKVGEAGELHHLIIKGNVAAVQSLLEQLSKAEKELKEKEKEQEKEKEKEVKDEAPAADASANANHVCMSSVVNAVDKFGFTPLMCAASLEPEAFGEGPVTLCRTLMLYDCDTKATDTAGNTALHWAAFAGNTQVLTLLCTSGSPLNHKNRDNDVPLHFASRWGQEGAVTALLKAGAVYDLRNNDNHTPLEVAADGIGENTAAVREGVRKAFYTTEKRLKTLILYHPECMQHKPRSASDWECPDRLPAVMGALKDPRLFRPYELEVTSDFDRATVESLTRVHSAEYIKFVHNLSKTLEKQGAGASAVPFTPMVQKTLLRKASAEVKPNELCDTSFSSGSLIAARRAAGAVIAAVEAVVNGKHRNAFCAVRPPGHHAGPNGLLEEAVSCGFCIFNNVAVGALHALEVMRLERVAVVDIDVHHGNGTEEIAKAYHDPSRLLFYSVHLFEKEGSYEFFPGSGAEDDTRHNVINVPILPLWKAKGSVSRGTRSKASTATTQSQHALSGRFAFREAVGQRLIPALRAFNPSLILLSSGFDAADADVGNAKHDKHSHKGADLMPEDYAWITEKVQGVADLCCNGKIVSVLEGGYGRPPPRVHSRAGRRGDAEDTSSEDEVDSKVGGYQASKPDIANLDRTGLAEVAASHVRALVDPLASRAAEEAHQGRDDDRGMMDE